MLLSTVELNLQWILKKLKEPSSVKRIKSMEYHETWDGKVMSFVKSCAVWLTATGPSSSVISFLICFL